MSASIHAEFITLNGSDGTTMRAYKARPEGAVSQSGLLVFQEAFGVNAHMRDVTERFARKGYLAVAPELFHRTEPGFEGCYDDFPSAMAHLQALKVPELEADLQATYDWLRANADQVIAHQNTADSRAHVLRLTQDGKDYQATALRAEDNAQGELTGALGPGPAVTPLPAGSPG